MRYSKVLFTLCRLRTASISFSTRFIHCESANRHPFTMVSCIHDNDSYAASLISCGTSTFISQFICGCLPPKVLAILIFLFNNNETITIITVGSQRSYFNSFSLIIHASECRTILPPHLVNFVFDPSLWSLCEGSIPASLTSDSSDS